MMTPTMIPNLQFSRNPREPAPCPIHSSSCHCSVLRSSREAISLAFEYGKWAGGYRYTCEECGLNVYGGPHNKHPRAYRCPLDGNILYRTAPVAYKLEPPTLERAYMGRDSD